MYFMNIHRIFYYFSAILWLNLPSQIMSKSFAQYMSKRKRTHERYIENPYSEYHDGILNPHPTEANRFQISNTASTEISRYFDTVIQNLVPSSSQHTSRDFSLYTGTGGICYLFLHLALYSEDQQVASQYLGWAENIYENSQAGLELCVQQGRRSASRISFVTGGAGIHGMGVALGAQKGDTEMVQECTSAILLMQDTVVQGQQDNEILYGRAGYLYALLWARRYAGADQVQSAAIAEVVDKLIEEGQVFEGFEGKLMYSWHDKLYFGGAHGVMGIVAVLLLALETLHGMDNLQQALHSDAAEFAKLKNQLSLISATVEYLVSQMNERGNIPSRAGAPERSPEEELVQWCHGAPGMVQMLLAAYRVFQQPSYLERADDAAKCIWEKGILIKGNGLCHGVGGNGYCFLQLYQVTNRPEYLYYAQQFALACVSEDVKRLQGTPDRPFSLFEGLAGELCFLFDILYRPAEGKFPCMF